MVQDYNSFPEAGGKVEELEALWDAVIGDFQEMMSGMSATLNGKGTKESGRCGHRLRKADMEMMKAELDAFGRLTDGLVRAPRARRTFRLRPICTLCRSKKWREHGMKNLVVALVACMVAALLLMGCGDKASDRC